MSDSRATVHVVGLAGDHPATPEAAAALQRATLVAGGIGPLAALRPLLEARPEPPATIALTAPLDPALERIATHAGPVAVLASGDPGWFGIVRTLARRIGAERIVVHPAPSSVARAWSRVALPWDDARVVSAHARGREGVSSVLAALIAGPKVAVLTAPDCDPAFLACAYARIPGAPERRLAVCERLDSPDQRVTIGAPEEIAEGRFADPNVLLAWAPDRPVAALRTAIQPARTAHSWALPEASFAHRDGMITKREVRAAALAHLGPGPGDLIWDVGAGSGSVGVECARLGAGVIAVDHDEQGVTLARRNAADHGVELAAFQGRAPEALAALPDPDAVFVGGGGDELDVIVDVAAARAQRAVVVTLATVERIGPTLDRLAAAGLETDGTLLQASRIRPFVGSHRLQPTNPTAVLVGRRGGVR
ncbi:precorrin-6y C5,15-methyltransferase (decarboxylating) subunit CbiE [Patulibacter defluvii]|uniref:precorrin-6y C5,15-methyltransferase (decarboxylating) subunit CbiE n=1 Tax=Patulibacter defluvii TaxID=3095358 RepID=UPI002A74C29A|nr:precorrin-6y C5,15-methyltransferase (decarboxylating) subunit CbiE [Patulibacter sp. DM4]